MRRATSVTLKRDECAQRWGKGLSVAALGDAAVVEGEAEGVDGRGGSLAAVDQRGRCRPRYGAVPRSAKVSA